MKNIDTLPLTIPDSRKKKKLLTQKNIPHVYLGQGLIFTPPKSADEEFYKFLEEKNISITDNSLDLLRTGSNKEGEVYHSQRAKVVWEQIEKKQNQETNQAFSSFTHDISRKTISSLFSLTESNIQTFQCDSLMMALEATFLSIEKTHKKITHILLPEKYQYSGYFDFFAKINALGSACEILYIPEVQVDGTQDLDALEEIIKNISSDENNLALFIDQEHNNNASGYDRNENLNDALFSLFLQNKSSVIYFGDIAYKGLKEDLLDSYSFIQKCEQEKLHAYFYCSFSKHINYRAAPNFKNILFATQSIEFSTEKILSVFQEISRPMGIGTSSASSQFIYEIIHDKIFQKEIKLLQLYISYIKHSLYKDLQGTELEKYFSSKTFGIFRCLPLEISEKLNEGENLQIITVGQRINILPLGCSKNRKLFIDKYISTQ